jgi:3-oxoacyl-[acyl-carrier-protein] synthase-3
MRSKIIGTGMYVPDKVVTNADLERLVQTSDEWITTRTGIKERRMAAPDQAASDLAYPAALRALEMAGVKPEEVEMIIVGTISPDMPFPSCAAVLQGKLGNKKAIAFDVSAACAGSLYALSIADKYVATGSVKNALVIGVEMLTRITDWTDRNTCVLFGDAAGAMVLGPTEEQNRGILSTHLHTDGSLWPILNIPGGGSRMPFTPEVYEKKLHLVKMAGKEVFKVAVRVLEACSREALEANKLAPSDITHVIAHQANLRILSSVLDKLGVPESKLFVNIQKYGNTSSASVPMTLDEANRAGRLKPGDNILMMAIGGGMAWGSALVRW